MAKLNPLGIMVSLWLLNEASGLADDAKGSNQLAVTGAVPGDDGPGNAALFIRANSEALYAEDWLDPLWNLGQKYHIFGWLAYTDLSNRFNFLSKNEAGGDHPRYSMNIYQDAVQVRHWQPDGSGGLVTEQVQLAGLNLPEDVLHFVEVKWDTDESIEIRINRSNTMRFTGTLLASGGLSNARATLGAQRPTANHTDGMIQQLCVMLGDHLSGAEADAIYNAGAGLRFSDFPGSVVDKLTAGGGEVFGMVEPSGVRTGFMGVGTLANFNTVGATQGAVTLDTARRVAAGGNFLSIADGSQDGLDLGQNNFGLHGWVYPESLDQVLLGKYQDAGTFWQLEVTAGGKLRLHAQAGGVVVLDLQCDTTLSLGRWYHVVASVDRVAGGVLWLNGADDTAAGQTVTNGNLNNSGAFRIFSGDGITSARAKLAQVAVLSSVPSQELVEWLYNSGEGRTFQEMESESAGEPTFFDAAGIVATGAAVAGETLTRAAVASAIKTTAAVAGTPLLTQD